MILDGTRGIMDPEGKCPACGRSGVACERSGHLELLTCARCGWEMSSRVFPGEEVANIGRAEFVRVWLHWRGGRATLSEIAVARKVIPALAREPLSRLLEEARDSPDFDLGEYSKATAVELRERAKPYGLVVVLGASTE
jgi:hypothetical protein